MPTNTFGHIFENIVFYDLIGVNDNEFDDIIKKKENERLMFELNKKVIERWHIDAVLIYPGGRKKCTYNIIKHLWKSAIFSEDYVNRPPKLVIAGKMRKNHVASDWSNIEELRKALEGFCQSNQSYNKGFILTSIQESLENAFCSEEKVKLAKIKMFSSFLISF